MSNILDHLNQKPLSELLQKLLIAATEAQDNQLIKWAKLELTGYQSPLMEEGDLVPEYRTVNGYHTDDFHHKLMIEEVDLQFINSTNLRASVIELEAYQEKGLILKDPQLCNTIFEYLNVKVTSFHVSSSQVQKLLAAIKCELISKVNTLNVKTSEIIPETTNVEDIIDFKPNFYGIGLNLNAMKKRWFPRKN
ncbi:hypothetical protein [Paraglaciecola sp. L3A3]|uniref:AbiTii domain-containing protein n=1 Tax=Paraglaciecola sp. L3A3 TaxID=2686358 RepID=UPI00131E30C9|nr:hypothetical protein [Paraglaciecola sp. L3A3]